MNKRLFCIIVELRMREMKKIEQLPEKLQDHSQQKKGDALEIKFYWLLFN